ncbi:DUF4331 family protein [Catellatospora paridis]|uniref:DUF4331 family protein n=1 Tax=Catellatospora paridis TaxID=1617086 RepID=UPI001E2A114A|nr:DUF4331 family protein [Catellatospora paridis]
MHSLTGDEARDDSASGTLLARGGTGEQISGGGVRVWTDRVADPFYVDLDQLFTINAAVAKGTAVDSAKWDPKQAKNSFANTTVQAIVVEVSHEHPILRPGAQVGVWCSTKLATDAGGWRQINRAGHPMMWPIFWPTDTDFSNPANDRHPSEDLEGAGKYLADQVSAVVAAQGNVADPQGYGWTVARRLFPDVLHYEVGTPATFGFAGINGRTLADFVPEVMFSLVLGRATPGALGPSTNERLRTSTFPHVVKPKPTARPHRCPASDTATCLMPARSSVDVARRGEQLLDPVRV